VIEELFFGLVGIGVEKLVMIEQEIEVIIMREHGSGSPGSEESTSVESPDQVELVEDFGEDQGESDAEGSIFFGGFDGKMVVIGTNGAMEIEAGVGGHYIISTIIDFI